MEIKLFDANVTFHLFGVFFCLFQGAVSGSVQASDRLMKELRDIYRSQSYKTGKMLQVSLLKMHFKRILLTNTSCQSFCVVICICTCVCIYVGTYI